MKHSSCPSFISFLLFFFLFQFPLEVKFLTGGSETNPYLNWTEVDKPIRTEKGLTYFFAIHPDYRLRLIATESICAAPPGLRTTDTFFNGVHGERITEHQSLQRGRSQAVEMRRCSASVNKISWPEDFLLNDVVALDMNVLADWGPFDDLLLPPIYSSYFVVVLYQHDEGKVVTVNWTTPAFQRKGNSLPELGFYQGDREYLVRSFMLIREGSIHDKSFAANSELDFSSRSERTNLERRHSFREHDRPQLKVFMVVPIKDVMVEDMWIFMKPFSWQLWLTIFMASFFVGISIGILEFRANDRNSEFEGPLRQQLTVMLWIPISMVVFSERRMVVNKWSKFVLLVWLVLSFIVFQCYVAKLTSLLTTVDDHPQPSFNGLERPHIAGYHKGSYVQDFLVKQLKFSESHLKAYSSIDEYHKALSKGSRNGGVDAIFDELPFVNLLLHKYTVVGPIDKRSAFGFKNSGCDEFPSISPQSPSLKARSFSGLFIITGATTIFALVCSEISQIFSGRLASNRLESMVHSTVEMSVAGDSPITDNQERRPTTSNQNDWNVSIEEEEEEEEEEVVHLS